MLFAQTTSNIFPSQLLAFTRDSLVVTIAFPPGRRDLERVMHISMATDQSHPDAVTCYDNVLTFTRLLHAQETPMQLEII